MPSLPRLLCLAVAALLLAGDAYAYSSTMSVIGASRVLRGGEVKATIDQDFQRAQYWQGRYRNDGEAITVTRASAATNLVPTSPSGFAFTTYANNNTARITPGLGLLLEEARTNQLLNSTAPVTQTTGALAATAQILWVNGSGSAALSNGTATGCTGTASQGSPVTFTPTAGTCTVTKTGSLNAFQLEAGTYGTSLIVTAGATATRAAETITVTSFPVLGATYSMFARGAPFAPINNAAINEYVLSIDDATNNNRASMYRDGTTAGPGFIVTSGGVSATQPAPTGTWAQNASGKVAFAVAANDLAATFNASAISAVGTATMPVTPTTVRLGQQPNGIRWWGGYIERIALWPTTRVPNGDLQRIAAP